MKNNLKLFLTYIAICVIIIMVIKIKVTDETCQSVQITIEIIHDEETRLNSTHVVNNCTELHEFIKTEYGAVINQGILYEIDDIDTDFTNDFIAIYVNNQWSYLGILEIEICNNCVYTFKKEIIE